MDALEAADKLRQLLVKHDNAYKQTFVMERYIECINRRLLGADDTDLNLLSRKIVADSTKKMFLIYRKKKWNEIQRTLKSITNDLENMRIDGDSAPPPEPTVEEETPEDEEIDLTEGEFDKMYSKAMSIKYTQHQRPG